MSVTRDCFFFRRLAVVLPRTVGLGSPSYVEVEWVTWLEMAPCISVKCCVYQNTGSIVPYSVDNNPWLLVDIYVYVWFIELFGNADLTVGRSG